MQRDMRLTMRSSPPLRATVVYALGVLLLAAAGPAAQASSSAVAYARAQHLRERLERQPEGERTRADYERVLDAYRAIYHHNPAARKADASILAVADLLAEEGRVFHDEARCRDAIGQYEFLRTQYPTSPWRTSALLTEGEIWQRDLHDAKRARIAYLKFLRTYPRSELAGEARADLRDLRRRPLPAAENEVARATSVPEEMGAARAAGLVVARKEQPVTMPAEQPTTLAEETQPSADGAAEAPVSEERTPAATGPLPLVKGIRHWSTPVYTRVAIDLQQEVRYEAVRVSHPDRVYFDLYGARLAPRLLGRQVRVKDDGFLKSIHAEQFSGNVTRIVLNVSSLSDYSAFFLPNPPRLVIDVHGRKGAQRLVSEPTPATSEVARNAIPAAVPAVHHEPPPTVQTGVFPTPEGGGDQDPVKATPEPTLQPVADTVAGTKPAAQPDTWRHTAQPSVTAPATASATTAAVPATTAPASRAEDTIQMAPLQPGVPTSMVRALGLKINRIVIDAGHGGHDSGTLGPGGIEEKNVVLDVALRLGRLLHERLGADVIYTRKNDTFIPLETRTAIANKAQADLFISIHANSSSDPTVRGVEVYYLNFTTSADALEVAARENAASDQSIFQLSSLVKKIALDSKINESREFAADVDQSLYDGLEHGNPGLRDRGVKKAPFVVLIGANMPSILAEISFLTNPKTAKELRRPSYRERIAESLYEGVAQYVSSLNGVRVAQAGTRSGNSE